MNLNVVDFINKICKDKSIKLFNSHHNSCFALIKKALPPRLRTQKYLDRIIEVDIARVVSPIIQKQNKIEQNRFWVLYYRLAEKLISMKCSQCNNSIDSLMCEEYILNRLLEHIKKFDIENSSDIFKEVEVNLKDIVQNYQQNEEIQLSTKQKFTYIKDIVKNYTQKILKRYTQKNMNRESIEAIIENALLSQNQNYSKKYIDEISYIEKELLAYCQGEKKELDRLLAPLLDELLYMERFFNFSHSFIHHRFLDFIRTLKDPPLPPEEINEIAENIDWEEILRKYGYLISGDKELILKLKYGKELENSEFIKLVYNFDYREIDILNYFENEEILDIKFYARNDIELSKEILKKITKVREKLKANSYINIEDETKRVALLKLIFCEEMKAKEIAMLLGYSEKKIYKKIENIKNKIKKELTLCKTI